MAMRILSIFITGLALMACSKKVVTPALPTAPSVYLQEIDFDYFHGKARVNINDGKKERDVKATIRIRKDSVIWMTFSVIGVQGGKALINRDSITIVSNMDNEYYVFDYDELSKRYNFPINYDVVQATMLGNLIKRKSDTDRVSTDMSFNILEQKEGSVTIRNFINSTTTKLERVELTESNTNNTMNINYRNFQAVNDKIFPFEGVVSLFYKTAAGVLNTSIQFQYNKAEVGDKELKFPFSIPRKYERR
jgi:hypothetical protein